MFAVECLLSHLTSYKFRANDRAPRKFCETQAQGGFNGPIGENTNVFDTLKACCAD
jgi:hypothetical protein